MVPPSTRVLAAGEERRAIRGEERDEFGPVQADRGHQVGVEVAVPVVVGRVERSARDRRAGLPDWPDASGVAGALLAMLTGYSQRLAVGEDIDTTAFRQALQTLLGGAT
jgi:hypothetical protein